LASVGDGIGGPTPAARAGGDTIETAITKATEPARTSRWPVPIFSARGGRDEQRMNIIFQKERPLDARPKILVDLTRFAPSSRAASIG
jgi:hypothetical protein